MRRWFKLQVLIAVLAGVLPAGAADSSPAPLFINLAATDVSPLQLKAGANSRRLLQFKSPTSESVERILSPESMEAGRKLYTAKCARCHKFYNPANYSDAKWREWMDKMSRKAKLKPDQKEILSEYLETFRTVTGTNTPGAPR